MSMKRLPAVAFGLLAVATVGAFFLTQHLKTIPPLVFNSQPIPAAFDPVAGRICTNSKGKLDYRRTEITIQPSHSDSVGVYVVNSESETAPVIRTLSSGTEMAANSKHSFFWDGRQDNGEIAPAGKYFFRVTLLHQGRTIPITAAVQVVTQPPNARVLNVTRLGESGKTTGPTVFTPPHGTLKISYTKGDYRRLWINIYRTDVAGKPVRVAHFPASDPTGTWARWNGEVNDQPAPAGTYLVGLTAQNAACDQATWPLVMPPAAGTTSGAGVTIRYLAVTPPLTPTVSGSRASVAVDSPAAAFTWTMHRSGTSKELAHGSGPAGATHIQVRMPRHEAGLYTLVVRSGSQSAAVPLVASKAGRAASRARVLVVLPMLTWIGNSPVDDTGDGLPDTLSTGDAVSLDRPLVHGPPRSLIGDARLLDYLNARHMSYQLTTDVALSENEGPSLTDRWGVVLPEGTDFLPASLADHNQGLPAFVRGGGRVLALGTGTLMGTSAISGYPANPRASAPTKPKTDLFGATRGPLTGTHTELITELADDLHLFGDVVAFNGYSHYQPIEPPAGVGVSAAGIASGSPAIVGFPVGSGTVVEVGLPNFGASLAHDVDSQELLGNVWQLLAKR